MGVKASCLRFILAELTAVERVLGSADEYIAQEETRYFHDDNDDNISRRHSKVISSHMDIARKSYVDNYLIMSERFIALFKTFLRSLDNENPNLSELEEYEEFAAAVRAARPKLDGSLKRLCSLDF